jgi:hypothetical protein
VEAQDLADVVALEGRPSGEALVEDDAEGAQVGSLIDPSGDLPGRLGGEVADRPHRDVPHGGVEAAAAGVNDVARTRVSTP